MGRPATHPPSASPGIASPSLGALVRYFLTLGTTGFGGPIALAGAMQRDLVDDRKWFDSETYFEGLAFSQLSPGPLAAQLAIYLGWQARGPAGAILAGFAFVLPSLVMVVVLAALYVRFGGLGWIQGAFYGIGAAVIAIMARSVFKLVRSSMGKDALLWLIFGLNALATIWSRTEVVWLILASGAAVLIARGWRPSAGGALAVGIPPAWWSLGLGGAAGLPVLGQLAVFFSAAGAFVFGSGLAIVPFLYGGVVQQHHWLTDRQFLDAVAVAMITPGPVVITAGFVGYLVAGPLGALVAAGGVFLPPLVIVLAFASRFRRYSNEPRLKAVISGVVAAAVGAIAGAGVVLGGRAIVDIPTALIGICTLATLIWARRIPEPAVIVASGGIGLALKALWAPHLG